jgi:hypothetical protein
MSTKTLIVMIVPGRNLKTGSTHHAGNKRVTIRCIEVASGARLEKLTSITADR